MGKAKANAKVSQTLFQKATNGDTTSIIFWLKTQAGWKETQYIDVTKRDAEELTDKELYDIASSSSAGATEEADSSKVTH